MELLKILSSLLVYWKSCTPSYMSKTWAFQYSKFLIGLMWMTEYLINVFTLTRLLILYDKHPSDILNIVNYLFESDRQNVNSIYKPRNYVPTGFTPIHFWLESHVLDMIRWNLTQIYSNPLPIVRYIELYNSCYIMSMLSLSMVLEILTFLIEYRTKSLDWSWSLSRGVFEITGLQLVKR